MESAKSPSIGFELLASNYALDLLDDKKFPRAEDHRYQENAQRHG